MDVVALSLPPSLSSKLQTAEYNSIYGSVSPVQLARELSTCCFTPEDLQNTTVGIVLVVLGATGVGSLVGYGTCALPSFCLRLCMDKALGSEEFRIKDGRRKM